MTRAIYHTLDSARTSVVERSDADALPKKRGRDKALGARDRPRFRLAIVSRRTRLLDATNLSVKYAEDALKGRCLPDDSPRYVGLVDVSEEKVLAKEVGTSITITYEE